MFSFAFRDLRYHIGARFEDPSVSISGIWRGRLSEILKPRLKVSYPRAQETVSVSQNIRRAYALIRINIAHVSALGGDPQFGPGLPGVLCHTRPAVRSFATVNHQYPRPEADVGGEQGGRGNLSRLDLQVWFGRFARSNDHASRFPQGREENRRQCAGRRCLP